MKLCDLMQNILKTSVQSDITGIACDSRLVEPGFVFVCIDGVQTDGHRFAQDALKSGAAYLVTQRDLGLPNQLIVENTREAWAKMSANWFGNPADKLRMIGVTGTNGKTSVTYLLKSIFEAAGYTVGLIGTIQTMVGDRLIGAVHTTPEPYELQSLLAMMADSGCTVVVMEVSSHALAQNRVETIHFDRGVFTNLTQDHLDFHHTMGEYAQAKQKLFLQSDAAVLNRDDPWYDTMRQNLPTPVITYSVGNTGADYTALELKQRPNGVSFELVAAGQIGRVNLQIPGLFSVYNAVGAAACALSLGVPFETVTAALSALTGVKGRAEPVPTGQDFTVVIDYAHTPDGLLKICGALRVGCKGRLITLFGCGGDRDVGKRPLMGAAAASLSDYLIVTSDNPRNEDPMTIIQDVLPGIPENTPYSVFPDRSEAIRFGVSIAEEGDVLLLAGKGHETYQVLKTGIIHLDEREVLAEALGLQSKLELGSQQQPS